MTVVLIPGGVTIGLLLLLLYFWPLRSYNLPNSHGRVPIQAGIVDFLTFYDRVLSLFLCDKSNFIAL